MTRLYRLALLSVFSAYALIVLGGITRISESGMGCSDDWPRCQGKWYPPLDLQSIIEYSHRTVAAYIGLLVLVIAVMAFFTTGTSKRTRWTALLSLVLVVVQALLGAVTVFRELPANIVTAHLGTAMLFLATTMLTTFFIAQDRGAPDWLVEAGREPGPQPDRRFILVAQAGALVIFILILSGGLTSTSGAALACGDWPLCRNGTLLPADANEYTWIHISHRLVALVAVITVTLVALAAARWVVTGAAKRLAEGAVKIIIVQVLIGASYIWTEGNAWTATGHLATATLLWAVLVALVVVARCALEGQEIPERGHGSLRPAAAGSMNVMASPPASRMSQTRLQLNAQPPVTIGSPGDAAALMPVYPPLPLIRGRDPRTVIARYVALTKPGILTLLLVTTLGAMLVAAAAVPALGLVLATMVGGLLAAGGANVLNCYVDRDIDALMPRTRGRGTASGEISPRAALTFGVTLSLLSILVLGFFANWLAAGLALAGSLYYVFVYTRWLKRTTPQNIVVGGAAGAVPPLVGWAAVTGELSLTAWLLFAVIFLWTPPHFWALALLKQGEYGRAQVPMLPVVAGEAETRRQIVLYSILLTTVALLLAPLGLGWVYLIAAVALNGLFLGMAVRLLRLPSKRAARQLFFFSLWYLALLYAAMVADRLLLV